MAKPKPRVKFPANPQKGEIITIKTLISHTMETGQRKDKKTGEKIPRKIINKFVAKFNGEEIFSVDILPAISANPYIKFSMKVEEPGEFEFTWIDDDGTVYSTKRELTVAS